MKDIIRKILRESEFDWTDSVPNPGQYNNNDLEDLILDKKLRIGYKIRLIGHAKDVDLVFNNVGTISDVYESHIKYQGMDDMDEYEYGVKILLDDVDGFNMYEYEINDTFGDQDDLTFDIISDNHLKESDDFGWIEDSELVRVGSCLETVPGTIWNFSRGRYDVVSVNGDKVTLRPQDESENSYLDKDWSMSRDIERFLSDGTMVFCQGDFVRYNLRGEPIQESDL